MKDKIHVAHVKKYFQKCVLDDISFEVGAGEFVAILGPSGCGKSTLLNMIAGLETCENGTIDIDDQNVLQPERHRMMMFQESALFPWYNVINNVMYGLRFKKGLSQLEKKAVALRYLKMVGLEDFANARIHELSGGMRQRVALARALAPNPQILLMDEPFSALDSLTCEQLYNDVQKIWQAQKKTVILVTHNIREAVVLAQRVIVFSSRPGRILATLSIDLPYPRSVHDTTVSAYSNQIIEMLRIKKTIAL